MFTEIKSCVQINNSRSDFFPRLSWVRQGENLSPLLFSIFANNLESFPDGNQRGDIIIHNTEIYLKLYALLYADATVLMATSKEELQALLDSYGKC